VLALLQFREGEAACDFVAMFIPDRSQRLGFSLTRWRLR
jgi:hypothetical protein